MLICFEIFERIPLHITVPDNTMQLLSHIRMLWILNEWRCKMILKEISN